MDLGLFSCWRLVVEWTSLASFVRSRCSSFMGIWPMVALSLSLFPNLSCARLASRIWLCSFVLLPSTGHFLGSGRTSFRFSIHCVLPRFLRSLARSLRMRAEAAFARARAGTGPDYPYLFCATHACTYRCLAPAAPRYVAFPTCRMEEVFSRWNTPGNSLRLTRRNDD